MNSTESKPHHPLGRCDECINSETVYVQRVDTFFGQIIWCYGCRKVIWGSYMDINANLMHEDIIDGEPYMVPHIKPDEYKATCGLYSWPDMTGIKPVRSV